MRSHGRSLLSVTVAVALGVACSSVGSRDDADAASAPSVEAPPLTAQTCIPCDCMCDICSTQSCSCTGACLGCKPIAGCCTTDAECTPYKCNTSTNTCLTTCSATQPCTVGTCVSGVCTAYKANGTACSAASQCVSGNCVDGFCCDKACTGQCESCKQTGLVGTCSVVPAGQQPTAAHTACPAPVGGTCGSACNGTDPSACHYAASGVTCGASSCTSGSVNNPQCDGKGACATVSTSCSPTVCDPSKPAACCASCTTAGCGCATGFLCTSTGICAAPGGKGSTCTTSPGPSAECTSPLVCAAEKVCCDKTCTDPSYTCTSPSQPGVCLKKNGVACTDKTQCASGNCADGLCCDTSCADQCEACDVEPGTCKPVPAGGKPHGDRTKCAAGGDPCKNALCDGKDRTTCALLPDEKTVCGADACTGSTLTSAATCDGAGNCKMAATSSCSPYACASDGKTCRTDCSLDSDCATGFICQGKACIPRPEGHCSDDGLSFIPQDMSKPAEPCTPFKCKSGACATTCVTTDDCAPGNLCDAAKCVAGAPAAPTDDSGGCSTSAPRGGSSGAFALLAVAAVLARRIRARSR